MNRGLFTKALLLSLLLLFSSGRESSAAPCPDWLRHLGHWSMEVSSQTARFVSRDVPLGVVRGMKGFHHGLLNRWNHLRLDLRHLDELEERSFYQDPLEDRPRLLIELVNLKLPESWPTELKKQTKTMIRLHFTLEEMSQGGLELHPQLFRPFSGEAEHIQQIFPATAQERLITYGDIARWYREESAKIGKNLDTYSLLGSRRSMRALGWSFKKLGTIGILAGTITGGAFAWSIFHSAGSGASATFSEVIYSDARLLSWVGREGKRLKSMVENETRTLPDSVSDPLALFQMLSLIYRDYYGLVNSSLGNMEMYGRAENRDQRFFFNYWMEATDAAPTETRRRMLVLNFYEHFYSHPEFVFSPIFEDLEFDQAVEEYLDKHDPSRELHANYLLHLKDRLERAEKSLEEKDDQDQIPELFSESRSAPSTRALLDPRSSD